MIPPFKSISLKEMHPLQIEALTEVIDLTLGLASNSSDEEALITAEAACDELMRLFGGLGVQVIFAEGEEASDEV